MKVKVNLDLIMNIPGEFQDDDLAISLINRILCDQLYVGVEFDQDDISSDEFIPIDQLDIINYEVIAGRIKNV